jgi:hypothetical protein
MFTTAQQIGPGNSRRAFPFPRFGGLHTLFLSSAPVPGGLPQRLVAQTGITAFPLAPKGAEAASGLPHRVVAVDDQPIHAVVIGLDQGRMISGKGIWRFHTTGLAHFQRRAKDCATPGAPFPRLRWEQGALRAADSAISHFWD